jgi:hypothetical protein
MKKHIANPDQRPFFGLYFRYVLPNYIFVLGLITLPAFAQDNNVWRIGIQFGNSANISEYGGGQQVANARFKQNIFQAPNINLVARCDLNKQWMLVTGVGFNDIGFSYSISENYSFATTKIRTSNIKADFVAMELPFTIYYKLHKDCKNNSWILGAGFVATLTEKQTTDKAFKMCSEGNSCNYLSCRATSNGGTAVLLRWSVGREKTFRSGSILQASLLVNMGFTTLASSTVDYTIDNQKYTHIFLNSGSSVGLRLAYFLKPFGKQ